MSMEPSVPAEGKLAGAEIVAVMAAASARMASTEPSTVKEAETHVLHIVVGTTLEDCGSGEFAGEESMRRQRR